MSHWKGGGCDGQRLSCIPPGPYSRKLLDDRSFKELKKPLLDFVENNRLMTLRVNMENKGYDRKIHDNAKFNLKLKLADAEIDMENRRDKLKTMLEDEDDCYRLEIINRFEAKSTSKIDEMRDKVKRLREEREIRHKQLVDEKLDQVFTGQCSEMRALLTQKLAKEIVKDWDEQRFERRRLECERQEEERMWACLNILDMEERNKREEIVQERVKEFHRNAKIEMDKQIEFKMKKKLDMQKLAAREHERIEADIAALAAGRKKVREENLKRFETAKALVLENQKTQEYYKGRRLMREEIVAKEFLKKAVRELYVEQEDRNKRKRDLMRAITIYRDYLKKWDCLQNSRDGILIQIIDTSIEEQHKKVYESRIREEKQKRRLFEQVMAGRKLQIEDLRRKKEREEMESKKELEMLKEDWKLFLAEMDQEKEEKEQTRKQYREDLDSQVEYNNLIKEREIEEDKRQNELGEIEEKLFNYRMKKTYEQADLPKYNPYRKGLVGKDVAQRYCPA